MIQAPPRPPAPPASASRPAQRSVPRPPAAPPRPPAGGSAGDLSTVALAMLVALGGTWAVMSADWANGTAVALLVSAAGVAEAALLARSSARRAAAVLGAPLLGLLVIVPLTLRDVPDGAAAGWRTVAAHYLSALGGGLFATTDWPFVVGLCTLLWLAAFWLGWMATREHRGVLALLPWIAVLAVNVLNAPSVRNLGLPEAATITAGLLLLSRVQLSLLTAEWRRRRVVALPGTASRFLRAGGAAVALILVPALILPPLTDRDFSGFLSGIGSGGDGGGPGRGRGLSGTGVVQFAPSIVPGEPLRNQPRNVLTYAVDGDAPTYLGVVVDSLFEEGNWYPSDTYTGHVPVTRGDIPRVASGVGSPVDRVTAHLDVGGGATGSQALALFPGSDPAAVGAPGIAFGDGAPGRQLYTVDRFLLNQPASAYTVTGYISTASEDQLRAAPTDYPDWVVPYTLTPHFSHVDDVEMAIIKSVADRWIVGTTSPYDAAVAIESHLRDTDPSDLEHFTYTLTPPPTRAGTWPIVDFLTRTRRGYCQYFASAMGALLRSEGIPTRLISGYGPGTIGTVGADGRLEHSVTTSDAHVWVEVFIPGAGWIPFEPTPDGFYNTFSRGPAAAGAGPTAGASSTATAPAPSANPQRDQGSDATANPDQATGTSVAPQMVGGAVALLTVVVLLLLGLRWMARPRRLAAVWRRIDVLGAALGVRRRPSETYTDYAGRLAAALPPDTTTLMHRDGSAPPGPRPLRASCTEALQQIAAAAGKESFSPRGLEGREAVQWRRAWDRVRRHAPLLLWRSFLQRTAR